jgi:hypothetical protein
VNYLRKSKIELPWSHIIALKAICLEDGDGILDLMVTFWDFVAICLCISISLSTLTSFFFCPDHPLSSKKLTLNKQNIHCDNLHKILLVHKQACIGNTSALFNVEH